MPETLDNFEDGEYRFTKTPKAVVNLHKTAALGTPEELKALLGSGIEVDARDYQNITPLMTAAFVENFANIRALTSVQGTGLKKPCFITLAAQMEWPARSCSCLTVPTWMPLIQEAMTCF